jgi:acyl-CoA dehydrogenase
MPHFPKDAAAMNFDDTPQEAAFRRQVRDWLDANAPKQLAQAIQSSTFGHSPAEFDSFIAQSKAWQRQKFTAGWACLHWPKEYGGRAATPIERLIWQQEEGLYSRLSAIFLLGHGMCGPTLLACGSEAQKRRLLPPMARGDEIWCQLFSEPSGGSDLAGLRTRAERDGENWIVEGQKIWTSGAHYADYGLLLARTDPTAPKHHGLTMFYVNMRSPGICVRPIKQINGQSEFNEVFFQGARVPDSQRIGAVGRGWQVSITTLMNERLTVGVSIPTGFPELLEFCKRLETAEGLAIDQPAVRSKLAAWAVRHSGLKYTMLRTMSALSRGETPGPENSIGKLVSGRTLQEIAAYALDLQGPAGALADPTLACAQAYFQAMLLRSPATRIEGGTDEILRNIIAERVLGLPADIRVDKSVPFNQIPTRARAPAQ